MAHDRTMGEKQGRVGSGRRPPLAAGCLAIGGMLLLLLFGYIWWANHLPPPEPDTRVMPNPNGFDAVNAAVGKLNATPRDSPLGSPVTADPAALRQALAPDRAALDELRRALRLEYMRPAVRTLQLNMSPLAQIREAARRFSAEATVARADGQWGAAIDRSLDAMELGSRVGQGGMLIDHLVGLAVSAIGQNQAELCISGLSAEEARAAGARLERIIQRNPGYQDALREERAYGLNLVRMGGPALMATTASAGARPSLMTSLQGSLSVLYPRSWTYGEMDAYYRALIAEAGKPYRQRQPPPLPAEPLTRTMAPSMTTAAVAFERRDTHLQLIRLRLALQEYRSRHGRYPAQLAALAPGVVKTLPTDPFSGQPFVYRAPGDGYLLYSVGPDGKDDGGRPISGTGFSAASTGDIVAGKLYSRRKR